MKIKEILWRSFVITNEYGKDIEYDLTPAIIDEIIKITKDEEFEVKNITINNDSIVFSIKSNNEELDLEFENYIKKI